MMLLLPQHVQKGQWEGKPLALTQLGRGHLHPRPKSWSVLCSSLDFPCICASVASCVCDTAASYNLEMTVPVLSFQCETSYTTKHILRLTNKTFTRSHQRSWYAALLSAQRMTWHASQLTGLMSTRVFRNYFGFSNGLAGAEHTKYSQQQLDSMGSGEKRKQPHTHAKTISQAPFK